MTNAYWSQWSSEELDSMQGKDWACHEEVLDDDIDIDVEDEDNEEEYDEPLSLESLGMSIRDFM